MPETNRERLARRAAEIRAGQADAQLSGVADEFRAELDRHAATIAGIFTTMEATAEALGLTSPEPERPRLRLVRDESEAS